MNTTQKTKHTLSEPSRLNRAAAKKLIPISLALMAALLCSASPAAAGGRRVSSQGMGPAAVNLRSAGSFAILSKTGITDVYASAIVGNVGTSPITGAALLLACDEVAGTIYVVDAAGPACSVAAPSLLTTAIGDMQTAYTDAAGRTFPTATELGAGNIDGRTITPGLYKWSSSVLIPTRVTLKGGPNDVWIFQIPVNLSISPARNVILGGQAQAKNIFWQVAGAVSIGTTAHFEGIILSKTAITLGTGASINGRLLAQTAVDLDTSTVTKPN